MVSSWDVIKHVINMIFLSFYLFTFWATLTGLCHRICWVKRREQAVAVSQDHRSLSWRTLVGGISLLRGSCLSWAWSWVQASLFLTLCSPSITGGGRGRASRFCRQILPARKLSRCLFVSFVVFVLLVFAFASGACCLVCDVSVWVWDLHSVMVSWRTDNWHMSSGKKWQKWQEKNVWR